MKKYRIVKKLERFVVQSKVWYFPFWIDATPYYLQNLHRSKDEALKFIEVLKQNGKTV